MSIKAVGFDFDGTLYPERNLFLHSLRLGLRNPRFFLAYRQARNMLRAPEPEGGTQSHAMDPCPGMSIRPGFDEKRRVLDAFRKTQAELIGRSLGMETGRAETLTNAVIYESLESSFVHIHPYRGVTTCLETLKGKGLRLAVLSDLPPWEKLKTLGLDGYFDTILCSECSGRLKPDRRPFLFLSDKLGVNPEEVLYVGNNWKVDIEGAHAAGMKTAYRGRRPRRDAAADFCFRDWGTLAQWILTH